MRSEAQHTSLARSNKAFGEPPHAYIVRRRLEEACHLMLTCSAPLSEIALSAGFADQSHLSKHFGQAFGQISSLAARARDSGTLVSADIAVKLHEITIAVSGVAI